MGGSVAVRAGRLKFNLAGAGTSAHKEGLQTDPTGSIHEVRGWRWLALWLLAALVRIWGRTLRFDMHAESLRNMTKSDVPVVFVLWHNRLFLTPELFRRYRGTRPIHGLVSASKDGAWLAAFYRMIGIQPVRGSSNNFGREAGRALVEVMRGGGDIGITPDGPRGPVYSLEPGVLVVARRVQAPMVLVGAEFGPAWRLNSWDRFYLPWPFTRVRVSFQLLLPVKADGTKASADELRATLLAMNPDGPDKNR